MIRLRCAHACRGDARLLLASATTLSPVSSYRFGYPPRQHLASILVCKGMSAATIGTGALNGKDLSLLRLFVKICCHQWEGLPETGLACLDRGASVAEVQGCVRHICVVAGYPPALAAAKKLHTARILPEATEGKAGGPPGNTFELVYADKRDRVWENLYSVDPVLSEWIRRHCYGDIYSTPGLDLAQKQLLTAAFLAEADMHDEFFGHVLAGLRFGLQPEALLEAIKVAFEVAGTATAKEGVLNHAARLVRKAALKVQKAFPDGVPALPSVEVTEGIGKPKPPPPLSE